MLKLFCWVAVLTNKYQEIKQININSEKKSISIVFTITCSEKYISLYAQIFDCREFNWKFTCICTNLYLMYTWYHTSVTIHFRCLTWCLVQVNVHKSYWLTPHTYVNIITTLMQTLFAASGFLDHFCRPLACLKMTQASQNDLLPTGCLRIIAEAEGYLCSVDTVFVGVVFPLPPDPMRHRSLSTFSSLPFEQVQTATRQSGLQSISLH